ncbi:uncharacterized protein LOC116528207 isoform X1 [Sapajus apella]|uniref:Uncharacterized protein LOC116528207 isoform X1 n=1 Tax=Sapajus apella TaxID=9515 RepID=A0A6J3F6S5_SAPAP|nr:uncharacterized protein LOC116528207 isoform X1 [Sapajus apella]
MPGRMKGKAGEWGAGGALKAQRRPTAKLPGQLVPEALLFAVGPVWGRGAEQKGTLCSHPARAPSRPPGRAAAAAAAARLRGIPPDLPLPLRLTLPCLAPVLDRRLPIYTGLGSFRLTLPSCSSPAFQLSMGVGGVQERKKKRSRKMKKRRRRNTRSA